MSDEYAVLDVKRITMILGDRILLRWQENKDTIDKAGLLVRPDTHKKAHFTGVVLKIGDLVSDEFRTAFKEAKKAKRQLRILFDQFSNFEKFTDPKLGRIALIEENKQGAAFMIIPPREDGTYPKIGGGESDFNYDL